MTDVQLRTRRRQRLEELGAASIRALSGERDLHFRGHRLHRGREALPWWAPHLHPDADEDDLEAFRGAADGLALRLARSDAALHRRLAPADAVQRAFFDLLEQFRAESLVPEGMPGVRRNLRKRHADWSLAAYHAGYTDSSAGLLVYTVAQVCRARVTGEPVVEETEDLLEATRAALAPALGTALAGLRRERHDQAAYAVHACAIARHVAALLAAEGAASGTPRPADLSERDAARSVFGLIVEDEGDTEGREAVVTGGHARVLEAGATPYRVFTDAYDRLAPATAPARRGELEALRDRLDRLVAAEGVNLPRLVRELQAALAVPRVDGWEGGREEGRIDGRRLAQLVASPAERRLFRAERVEPHADAAVTFLVDCSGSMKAHAETLAVLLDVLARALEQAGAACEVLGFTTGAWSGGRAQRDWLRAGRPPQPGRLNEALHIVFKDAATPWRRARTALAALLKADLFREGIDGEAVDWAAARLGVRDEARKLLLVVSDGAPMDTATALANDPQYLDRHLRDVVARHEVRGAVAIQGVGVGLDLSPWYRRSHVLDLGGAIGHAMFREVLRLIARG